MGGEGRGRTSVAFLTIAGRREALSKKRGKEIERGDTHRLSSRGEPMSNLERENDSREERKEMTKVSIYS